MRRSGFIGRRRSREVDYFWRYFVMRRQSGAVTAHWVRGGVRSAKAVSPLRSAGALQSFRGAIRTQENFFAH